MTVDEHAGPSTDDRRPDPQASYRMKIGGMSCSFCTSTIRKAYERIDGVHDVGVSLAHEEGLVRYDPDKVTPDQLRRTLEQVGYTYRDPEKVRSFEDEERELRVARNRLLVAGTFTVVALVMMLLGMWLQVVRIPLMPWVALTLALETMFVTAWFVKKMAWASLRRGILNQHVLLEFAAFAGLVGGLLEIFVSPRFPALLLFPAADFFAVSVFVTTYHLLSDYVSKVVRTRSSQAVRQLMALQLDTARVLRDGQEVEVPVNEIQSGDHVRIHPGESVPVDGQVVDGASAVDESLVTGEAIPTEKVRDDEVIGGSMNQTGTLVVEVTRVGEESFLAQVARSIEEARALRPGVLQLVDTVLTYFVPAVLLFAAASFLGWTVVPLVLGDGPNVFRATFAALAVLVLGYPCALGMSTPLAMIRGGGEAPEQGILMRSGEAFQVMGEVRSIVLDKTGTIARGRPTVHVVVPLDGAGEGDVLSAAASAESASEHPLARSIEDAAEDRGLDVIFPDDFAAHTGSGVEATVAGARVLVGKPGFLAEQGIDVSDAAAQFTRLEERALTAVGVVRDGALLGLIGIGDEVKADAAATVERMNDAGITPVMITGDNERTANAVAGPVGIDSVLADVLPAQKADEVRRLQQFGSARRDGRRRDQRRTRLDPIGRGIRNRRRHRHRDRVSRHRHHGRTVGVGDGRPRDRRPLLPPDQAEPCGGLRVQRHRRAAATTGFVHPVWAMIAMIASVSAVLINSFRGRMLRGLRSAIDSGGQEPHDSEHGREKARA